jgi:LDH2 family malate/lactate/ureidoglycolate dehydrogenase
MNNDEVVIPHQSLACFSQALLEAVGIAPENARLVADSVVSANLRGVDSHGVQLLPPYIERILAGDIDIHAAGHVVSENGSALVYDGENGIGHVVAAACCDHAIRLAHANGFSMVVARESSHFGTAAYWAERLSSAGFIGLVMCTASPSIAPWQSKEKKFGTNPICMSVPSEESGGWLLDMATTTVSRGRIAKAVIAGDATIPPGWAMDKEGRPTTSPEVGLNGLAMPLGGYKGSGLAVMVEILCAVLSGGGMLTDAGGIWVPGKPLRVNQMFAAIDVARFMPLEQFQQRMERLVQELKSAAPAEGYDEVLVAGDPEWRCERERLSSGVPVEAGVWKKLSALAQQFSVALPSI